MSKGEKTMLGHVGERTRPVTFEGGVNELVNTLKTVLLMWFTSRLTSCCRYLFIFIYLFIYLYGVARVPVKRKLFSVTDMGGGWV